MVSRTIAAVKDRLTREINYWDRRANELKEQELAVVFVGKGVVEAPIYIKKPFGKEPDFAVTSVNYNLKNLIARGEVMS